MAAPSPWRWSVNSPTTASLHSSTSSPLYYTKRRRVVHWSSNFNFSSRGCAVTNASSNRRERLRSKPVETAVAESDSEDNEVYNTSPTGKSLIFKSLFGKRALWRRIFFASQKVRSIILLNAITIIYGKILKFVIFL